jgi:hypothetical protein
MTDLSQDKSKLVGGINARKRTHEKYHSETRYKNDQPGVAGARRNLSQHRDIGLSSMERERRGNKRGSS